MSKPRADLEMAGNEVCASEVASRDAIQNVVVTPLAEGRNRQKHVSLGIDHFGKAKRFSEMEACANANDSSISRNSFRLNELDGVGCDGERSRGENVNPVRRSRATATRWMKFNFVGAIGIVVQFAVLFLLKSVMHLDYLFATALAVEASVVHNFVWHERFTWKDRVNFSALGVSAPKGVIGSFDVTASLKRCPDTNPRFLANCEARREKENLIAALKLCGIRRHWSPTITRFVRFNLAAGGVSIIGNVALMKLLVGLGHVNYLVANGIAIVLCSLANFLVSDEWVFKGSGQ
jgi:putative flippase GtrA